MPELGVHRDERGEIRDLLAEPIDGVTRVTTLAGRIRGNHIHHQSWQWNYLASGRLRVAMDDGSGVRITEHEAGELIAEPPGVRHAWQAITDTEILVFRRGPATAEGYETDVQRLPEDEWLLR